MENDSCHENPLVRAKSMKDLVLNSKNSNETNITKLSIIEEKTEVSCILRLKK